MDSRLTWQTFEIDGKPAEIHSPQYSSYALLFLHPRGNELLTHPAAKPLTDALIEQKLAICCPVAPGAWWSDKLYPSFDPQITAEQHLLNSVVPWMRGHWKLEDRAIAVAGISMGGQAALRLGFKYPERFPVVASIAGAIDFHDFYFDYEELPTLYRSREAARQDTATLHVRQSQPPRHIWFACDPLDPWYRGNDRLREKLRAVGAPHTADLETQAGGHSWDYFNAMARPMLEFMINALAKERRRLV